MAIWKWAKANGIDHGLPLEKVHDAINTQFFSGMAPPEWINDILSGRKTPFKALATDVWKAQYNRRIITQQAKDLVSKEAQGPLLRGMEKVLSVPRRIAVFGHGFVFPVTHAGDLALRPQSWATFFRGVIDTYRSLSPAASERLLDSMKRQPLYDMALRSGLDVGEKSHAGNLVIPGKKGTVSERAWSALTVLRYNLWDHEMQKWIKPGMSQQEILDVGKNMAGWANHATGSAKVQLPRAMSAALFGPKLTASKAARMVADPLATAKTFLGWRSATAGEKAVALTRLSGLAQYTLTGIGLLAVNQGFLQATGQKQSINFSDPNKSDWLKFKGAGLEFGLPGLHSEIRTLGQIMATSYATPRQLRGESREAHVGQILGQYALGKATPAIGLAQELVMGQDWLGRPMPWSAEPGKGIKQRLDWWQYALAHAPIPLSGPAGYVYNQLKAKGASAMDASGITKAIIMSVVGATGLHVGPDWSLEPKSLQQAVRERRAAAALRKR